MSTGIGVNYSIALGYASLLGLRYVTWWKECVVIGTGILAMTLPSLQLCRICPMPELLLRVGEWKATELMGEWRKMKMSVITNFSLRERFIRRRKWSVKEKMI